ncbi:uncharacterized protein Bfra_008592 [Botrytis fragariae]|uniref:Uncharacterized protein n=1 Tax=Botrytis fragariae TaxID=1964551 RepID=A0A8H6ATS1_9HELO|nr:uncharacterized protein Bfra_008592 [Botrytis fragariae]KAF5873310.1 hypothetical protein Bfra_008592 [Botrytis fragariae]
MIVRIWLEERTMLVNHLFKERSVYGGMAFKCLVVLRVLSLPLSFISKIRCRQLKALMVPKDISSAIAMILFARALGRPCR